MKNLPLIIKGMALLLVVCVFGSCAKSLLYWNQAIKSFEQGAELELKSQYANRLDVQGDLPLEALPNLDELVPTVTADVPVGASPDQYYKMADDKITQALAAPAPLIKEGKMGNALTIKALSCWKTGQMAAARTNARAAVEAFAGAAEDSPRDAPLANAIPGLVALDLAYDSTKMLIAELKERSDSAPDADRADNLALLEKASAAYREFISNEENDHAIESARIQLQAAMETAGENREVELYLELCELTGLKNRFDFWAQLNNFAKRSRLKSSDEELKNWLDEEEQDYLRDKDAALERLKALLDGDERHGAYRFWDGIL